MTAEENFTIQDMREEHIDAFVDLYQKGVPRAVFSLLGQKFIARFFMGLAERLDVSILVGLNSKSQVHGTIVGILHRREGYISVVRKHFWTLLFAARWRLLSLRVLIWIARGAMGKLKRRESVDLPSAELLFISVCSEARGMGLAQCLVRHMENRFREMGFAGEYTILTETNNVRANRFYKRLGAVFYGTVKHCGILINCYHKSM